MRLKKRFASMEHKPSPEQLEALLDIPDTIARMAKGELEEKFYLSSLHPGVGKSTTLAVAVETYQEHHVEYGDPGVIMCFDRLEEIARMIKDLNIPAESFAVKVANDVRGRELMSLGSGCIDDALILLTTKQQLLMPGERGKHFADMSNLFYHGKPRRIRIWDESLICGKGRKLIGRKLAKLPDDLSDSFPALANHIEKIVNDLRNSQNADTYFIQDLNTSQRSALSSFKWRTTENRDTAYELLLLLGRMVTVRSSAYGYVAIDCDDSVPVGFAPCLITDASGGVRHVYKLQEQYRGNLDRLKDAPKDYSKLTVHVWRHASGKTAYKEHGNAVYVKEIVDVINSRPTEGFLVLRHFDGEDLERDIIAKVTNSARVQFIHNGIHTATNLYRDLPNMIIAGVIGYRTEDYEALARAVAGLTTSKGVLSPEDLNDTRHGEYAHHLLQAGNRIRMRKSEGAGCPEARLWLIAPKGILPDTEIATKIFPGCKVERWRTTPRTLKGFRLKALDYVTEKVTSGILSICGSELRKYLGMTPSNFTRDIIQNEDFNDALQVLEIRIEKRSNGRYFFNDNSYLRELVSSIAKSNQTPIRACI